MQNVLLYIAGVVIVALGVLISIVLHEAGHFVPAKLFKVRVGQFMVGFGNTLWSRKWRGTEFGIKALPLGGYISMSGMYPPLKEGGKLRTRSNGFFQKLVQDARDQSASTIVAGEEDHVFYKLPVWKRIIIMFGGPVMNLIIGIVLWAIVICLFGIPAATTTLSAVPRCVKPATSTSSTCAPTDALSPAAAAGLRPGDRLESINGTAVSTWDAAASLIRSSPGTSLSIVVLRAGHDLTLTATPVENIVYVTDAAGQVVKDAAGKAETQTVGYLGIAPTSAITPQPISAVLPQVGTNVTSVAGIVINLPQRLVGVWNAAFSTAPRDPNGPIGLVGVGRIAGEVATDNAVSLTSRFEVLLQILAEINIALFVFNLIPLMPLDGGHILGALWEGLKRGVARLFGRKDPGPVDTASVVPLTFAVVVVLGAMSLLLLYADIVKPITLN